MTQDTDRARIFVPGWHPDSPSPFDFKLERPQANIALPSKASLRPIQPPNYDQGQIGKCTGEAWRRLAEMALKRQGIDFSGSSTFIYQMELALERVPFGQDQGAQIRDGGRALSKFGIPSEKSWSEVPEKFGKHPTASVIQEALRHRATRYERVSQDANALKLLITQGEPFAFGITVFSAFESAQVARTGQVEMPDLSVEQDLGGHAIVGIGYDDQRPYNGGVGMFEIANSWGGVWGDAGNFWLPYPYVLSKRYSGDFWRLEAMSAA